MGYCQVDFSFQKGSRKDLCQAPFKVRFEFVLLYGFKQVPTLTGLGWQIIATDSEDTSHKTMAREFFSVWARCSARTPRLVSKTRTSVRFGFFFLTSGTYTTSVLAILATRCFRTLRVQVDASRLHVDSGSLEAFIRGSIKYPNREPRPSRQAYNCRLHTCLV